MTGTILIATLLMAPAPDSASVPFLVYDRASMDQREVPEKFHDLEKTRERWSAWLVAWGSTPLGPDDTAWMVDCDFSVNVEWLVTSCGVGGRVLDAEKVVQPVETMWPKDRGVWRGCLLVLRGGGGAVEPQPGLGLKVNPIGPSPDYCVTVNLPEK